MRYFLIVTGVVASLWAGPVQAQAGGGSRAAAEALFNEGRALMAKGAFSQACPKFEASQQLDPGLGTQLNLAECYEKLGKTASAWAEYREAIPLARASGSKVREDLALERTQALEARLSTLTIRAMGGGKDSAALEIRRDGVPVQPAELGSAIPVDPGQHTVEATAPGKKKWTSTVVVADGSKLAVEVPPLAPDAATSKEGAVVINGSPATVSAPVDAAPSAQPGSGQRTAAVVVGAVGVVGVGLGTLFGLQARSAWSDAKKHCPSFQSCDGRGVDLHSTAASKATLSTVAFIAGGAALAAGAVLWLTADSGHQERVAIGFGPGAAFVRGSFQ